MGRSEALVRHLAHRLVEELRRGGSSAAEDARGAGVASS
jgi:hypothetical protein